MQEGSIMTGNLVKCHFFPSMLFAAVYVRVGIWRDGGRGNEKKRTNEDCHIATRISRSVLKTAFCIACSVGGVVYIVLITGVGPRFRLLEYGSQYRKKA
jgi:hypothetical protein